MLSRGSVCWRCRVRALRRHQTLRDPQWRAKANISSADWRQSFPDGDGEDDLPGTKSQPQLQPQRAPALARRRKAGEARLVDLFLDATPDASVGTTPLTDGIACENRPDKNDEKVISAELSPSGPEESSSPKPGVASRLSQLLLQPDAKQAWDYFVEHLSQPNSLGRTQPAFQDLPHFQNHRIFRQLLAHVVDAWIEDASSKLPPPSSILDHLEKADAIVPKFYIQVGWSLVVHLLQRDIDGTIDVPGRCTEAVLEELITVWTWSFARHAKDRNGGKPDKSATSPDWVDLEVRARSSTGQYAANLRVEIRLRNLLMEQPRQQQLNLSALALISYDLLLRHGRLGDLTSEKRAECQSLILILARVLHARPVERQVNFLFDTLWHCQSKISPSKIKEYLEHLSMLPKEAISVIAPRTVVPINPPPPIHSIGKRLKHRSSEDAESYFAKYILHAGKIKSGSRLVMIWSNVVKYYTEVADGAVEIPMSLYRLSLCEFLAVRKGNEAMAVWKTMLENKVRPGISEFTAMMTGYRRGKDFDGAERVWNQIISLNIQPDIPAWTDRIHALMQGKRPDDALDALDDMFLRWVKAVATQHPATVRFTEIGDVPGAIKPNIAVINAMLTGYVELKDLNAARKALKRAKDIGVQPDWISFAILIQIALAMGDTNEASNILLESTAAKLPLRPAMLAPILDRSFREDGRRGMTPQQSEQRTRDILDQLKELGWERNYHLLAIIVDGLLKQHNNYDAAMMVVNFMSENRINPSEAMYTSILSYYFSRSPPDTRAVKMLLLHMSGTCLSEKAGTMLYDRVIQGYANCDHVDDVMFYLRRMSRDGRRNTWRAYFDALCALSKAGRFDLVEEFVLDLERRQIWKAEWWEESPRTSVKWEGFGEEYRLQFVALVQRLWAAGEISRPASAGSNNV